MTHKIKNILLIQETNAANCSICNNISELRPYGKDGAWVCFDCAMKDEAEAKRQFSKLINGRRDI